MAEKLTVGGSYRSGQSIFARPKPIDLSAARRAGVSLDMDVELSDDESDGIHSPLHRNQALSDAQESEGPSECVPGSDIRVAQAKRERGDENNIWAEFG
jgi:hypothetical protein